MQIKKTVILSTSGYHVTPRLVHRQFLFQDEEQEHFRILMRMF